MRLNEAVAVIAQAVDERTRAGGATEVEALGCEPAGTDCVVLYAWFEREDTPLTVIVDLEGEMPVEAACEMILAALRSSMFAHSVH